MLKILLIRMSSLGDVLLTTPLIRLLRQKYPDAQIDYLIGTEYQDIIRYNPYISRIIEFDKTTGIKGLYNLKQILKSEKHDIILDLHRNLRSYFLTFHFHLLRLGRPAVYRVNKHQIVRYLLVKFKINLYHKIYRQRIPVWRRYIRTARALDVSADNGQLDFFYPPELENQVDRELKTLQAGEFWIVVAPGAKHFTKRWPASSFARLIDSLYQHYRIPSIMVGDARDRTIIEQIQQSLPEMASLSVAGKFSILQTAVLIKKAVLVIANDSGLMHVASAFNKPLIAIFGSTVREFGFFPSNNNAKVIENENLYCRPCTHIGRSSCPEEHFRCMLELTPDLVLSHIEGMQVFS